MAKAGDLIENPATGERITFLQTTTRPTASCCASSTSFLPVSPYPSTSTPTRRSATRSSLARSEAAWEAKSGTTEEARGWLAQRVCPTLGKPPAGTSSCVSSASCVHRLYSRPSWRPPSASRGMARPPSRAYSSTVATVQWFNRFDHRCR
jgi:hypothetical protein